MLFFCYMYDVYCVDEWCLPSRKNFAVLKQFGTCNNKHTLTLTLTLASFTATCRYSDYCLWLLRTVLPLSLVLIWLISPYYLISTMVNRCCIVGCNSATHDRHGKKIENGLTFHRFPAWRRNHGDQVSEITKSRRLAWIAAVRRPNITFHSIPMSMRVCSLHFHSGKLKMHDFIFIA